MNDLTTLDTGTLAILNKSEIDQQISTARAFPRDVERCQQRVLKLATLTEAGAVECLYALVRTDADGTKKVIEGPSIRFAEVLAATWGNCRAGARITEESHEFITAQGIFHDLESNAVTTQEVRRRIVGKSGRRYTLDMIGVTANAACSIALRNAILRGVPKALWADIFDQTRKVAAGTQTTIHNRRADAMKAFQVYGIDEARILARLGVTTLDDVSGDALATLRGLYNAIREGEVTPESAFPALQDKPAPAPGTPPKTLDEFAKPTEPHDPETGEVLTQQAKEPEAKRPQAAARAPTSGEAAGDASTAGDPKAAYHRGTEARRAGLLLRAVPPEYRVEGRREESTEWKRGWMDEDYRTKQGEGAQ